MKGVKSYKDGGTEFKAVMCSKRLRLPKGRERVRRTRRTRKRKLVKEEEK